MSAEHSILSLEAKARTSTIDILFVGAALAATKKVFGKGGAVRCEHVSSSTEAIEVMSTRGHGSVFDCVMVDMRHREDGSALNVVAIAALQTNSTIVVLCQPEQAGTFRNLTGVHKVIPAPVEPKAILNVISGAVERRNCREAADLKDSTAADNDEIADSTIVETALPEIAPAWNAAEAGDAPEEVDLEELARYSACEAKRHLSGISGSDTTKEVSATPEAVKVSTGPSDRKDAEASTSIKVKDVEPKSLRPEQVVKPEAADDSVKSGKPVTKGFETTLSKIQEADQQAWRRFVPLANFAYKKLAIVVLTALFLTFLAYGAMIVFFMSSSSWSLPFELSRGHILVEKTERDLSSLRLRRNQVQQEINTAEAEQRQAQREKRDGEKQLTLTRRTVEEEIILQKTQKLEIQEHITRLKQVIRDFNRINGRGGFAKSLDSAYARRLITKKSLNSGTLAVLETLHRIAVVNNEISIKQIELQRTTRKIEFLESLLEELSQPEVRVITSAGSDLSYLARDTIEAKNRIALAERTDKSLTRRLAKLHNSYDVLSENLTSLLETPAARALKAPVMVLFVPYTNADNVATGEPLYSCALSIFACSKVGEVGPPVRGETTAVHPLFGKPMRGKFVEANFRDARSVTAEIVHAGRRPLLF